MTLPKLPRHLIPLSALTLLMAALSSPMCHQHSASCDGACAILTAANAEITHATSTAGSVDPTSKVVLARDSIGRE
jgi:hypothetical protein